ncbi:MAG TPA: hypothetical protein PKE69_07055 [Pyrinomonadaceae bacterium]|nr:hypothetical protein [Pyrinomonadaceae bacterium]
MKKIKTIGFLVIAIALLSVMVSKLNAQTCGTNGQLNGVFYMVCFSRLSGETTDTQRIRRALDAVEVNGGGRLVFSLSQYGNGTYYVDDTITLDNGNSNLIIEGVTKRSVVGVSASTIQLKGSGTLENEKPLFKIEHNVFDVTIRDIGLAAETKTYTTAILAKNTSSNQSSTGFKFSNIVFSRFDKGIHVKSANGTTSWQFDNVRLDHCSFEYTNTGIQLDADNTGWNMSSIAFNEVPENGYAMKLIRSGYVSMDLIIGNGTCDYNVAQGIEPPSKSETFIYVKHHGNLSIKSSASECFKKGLDLDGQTKTYPVYVVNNVFDITIKNTSVVSIANQYGNFWRVYKPQVSGASDVTSIGDRFCYPLTDDNRPNNYCANSKFELIYSPTGPNPTLQIMSNQAEVDENLSKALLKIQNANPNKTLLELGNFNGNFDGNGNYIHNEFNYALKRNGIGWLSFEASQADPYRGFSFNGPVKLPEYTVSNLPVGIAPSGSMVFCSNCQENTNPCQGGGNGALAIVIQGQWRCK